ncbi:sporulation protein YunB [Clostridia bacterium]|nr:sporulation protein YunB [Clostridia bacterium]
MLDGVIGVNRVQIWIQRRRRGSPPRGKTRAAAWVAVPLVIILAALAVFWVQSRMRPQVEQLAAAEIHNLAARAVNDAVASAIDELGIGYDDLIHFEKDAAGRITALKTDMVTANRVKASILAEALENIHALSETDISIPLGGLLSGDLVVGRGPRIPVRLVPIGAVTVGFDNKFSSAGINQTLHQVMINITTSVSVLLPGSSTEQTVEVEICIAETVIVGEVPATLFTK